MLSTDDDSPSAALACGEALSAVLLECTMAGLATCPVAHLTELSVSRELLAAVTGHTDLPQTPDPGRRRTRAGRGAAGHAAASAR